MTRRSASGNRWRQEMERQADSVGNLLVDGFHFLALFAIGAAVVYSATATFVGMVLERYASIEGILLLFIYLELGAMVGIYFKTKRMPVRFLIYVAITALTRMLIGHINVNHTPDMGILLISGAILLLAIGSLVLRFGSSKYPAPQALSPTDDH